MSEIQKIKDYLERLERNRKRDEPLNKNAYQGARELSAIVSLAEHGNGEIRKIATKALIKIGRDLPHRRKSAGIAAGTEREGESKCC